MRKSPVLRSMWIRTLSAGPRLLRDADSRAVSSASKRTSLSIPFSPPPCSRILIIEHLGREKGIDKEVLFEALETALLSASRKSLGPADNVRIHIDRKTGDFRIYQRKQVVEDVTDPETQIALADAKALNPAAELGVELELLQDRPLQDLGRIAAQTAKQVILQKVRDAEREGIYSEFVGKEGQILRGVVHRIEKRNVILEVGKAEAILPEREQIPGERYNPGDRVRAYVLEVRRTA